MLRDQSETTSILVIFHTMVAGHVNDPYKAA